MTSIKFYPLPDGNFVVSYFDELRRVRIQSSFGDEGKAKDFYNGLRSKRPVREQKRSLGNCTIEELLEVYLEEVPEASLRKSPQLIRDFLASFALFKIEDLDELRLRSFYTRQKLEYDYTNYSLSTRKYQIQGFFKWLISRGIVEESPQDAIRMGKARQYRQRPMHLPPEKIDAILAKAQELSPGLLYPILRLAAETAAKTTDLSQLKWTDIELKKGSIRYHGSEKIQLRQLTLTEKCAEALKRLDTTSERVFTTLEGRPLQKHTLVRELRIFQRRANFETNWAFRDLRHSYAVNFMRAGGSTEDLQKILGHWHPRLTEELYGEFKVHKVDLIDSEGVSGTGGKTSENCRFGEF